MTLINIHSNTVNNLPNAVDIEAIDAAYDAYVQDLNKRKTVAVGELTPTERVYKAVLRGELSRLHRRIQNDVRRVNKGLSPKYAYVDYSFDMSRDDILAATWFRDAVAYAD